jgi:hypothetical protein
MEDHDERDDGRRRARRWPWAAGLAVLAATAVGTVVVVGGGDDALEPPTTTPRRTDDGWEWAVPGDVIEVSRWERGTEPTAAQRAETDDLARRTRAAVRAIVTAADAAAAGYEVRDDGDSHAGHDGAAGQSGEGRTVHLVNPDLVADGRELDPEHPEALVLDAASDVVYGAMFLSEPDRAGPQASPAAPWHYHFYEKPVCFYDDAADLETRAVLAVPAPCPEGRSETHRSPEMLHVWLVDNPAGAFASEMLLDGSPGELERIA